MKANIRQLLAILSKSHETVPLMKYFLLKFDWFSALYIITENDGEAFTV